MDDTFKEAVRAVESVLGTKQNKIEWRPATLGDGHGTVSTGNNMVYCRLTENSSVIEVLNLRCAPVDGLRVRIAKTPEMPLVWQVIGQDDQRTDENGDNGDGVNYNVGPHHRLHEYLGVDQVNVDWRQITNLRVYAAGGMLIGVLAGLIPRPGSDLVVATQTIDLSSSVPASGALYALITVDAAGALAVTAGTAVDSYLVLALSDIPDTPAGHFRLAAVRLYFGQAAINESTVSNDIRDLRYPQENIAGESGNLFGVQPANTIYAGPVTGADALPTFRAGVTDDIASGVFPIARGGTNAATANDALNNLLPSQSGQDGNSLHTDGANSYWGPGGGSEGTIVITALPIGTITGFGGSSIPSGWLECNGAAVSRTTYADLFTAISTTYGVGDGSTTFNLPDLRGRVSIGQGTGSGLTPRTIGATGGSETHTLSTAEIASHTHTVAYDNESAGTPATSIDAGAGFPTVTGSIPSGASGGGGAHNNVQPFLVTAFIIKYTDTATSALIFDDGADPENVTLTADPGADVYAARRDHIHALDVTISPTWTGDHTFDAPITLRNDSQSGLAVQLYRGDDPTVHAPAFAGYRAYGTLASPSDAGINAVFARFSGRGRGSSAWPASATGRIDIAATEAQTSSAQGTDIRFYTTPNGSTTIGLAATITQDKLLTLVNPLAPGSGGTGVANSFTLTISGNSTINGSLVGNITGGGTLATGGFTLTVPATGQSLVAAVAATVVGYVPFYSTTGGVVTSDAGLSWNNTTKQFSVTSTSFDGVIFTSNQANGSNIKLTHTGATNPNKYFRSKDGNFEVINSAYSARIFSITDSGMMGIGLTADAQSRFSTDVASTSLVPASANVINITNQNATTGNMSGIWFGQSDAVSNGAGIMGVHVDRTGGSRDTDIAFYNSINSSVAERVRIKGVNLGVATTMQGAGVTYHILSLNGSQLFVGADSSQESPMARFAPSYATNTHASYKARLSGYVWDIGGERQWLQVDTDGAASDVLINSLIYGSMYADDIAQAVVVAAAGTEYEVGGSLTGGSVNGFTFQNSKELLCTVAGNYLVNWSMSLSAGNNDHISGGVMINSTAQHNTENAAHTPGAGDQVGVAGTGVITLAVNDLVKLFVENESDTDDIEVNHANLALVRIGA